jgi:hypothetical protein
MADENTNVNVYLRAISDPSGFRQFAQEQEAALRQIGAITEASAARINAAIAGVENRTITALAGLRELNAVINSINPTRLQAIGNLGFDPPALDRAAQQLGQIDSLLASIQSRQSAIVRTASGLGVSSRITGNVTAITGGPVPVQVEKTGQQGTSGVYQITSSLGTQIVQGQKEAIRVGNQTLIAELNRLRVSLLAQAATSVSGETPEALPVGDLRANTSATTANTAAINRETQALARLERAVYARGSGIPVGSLGAAAASPQRALLQRPFGPQLPQYWNPLSELRLLKDIFARHYLDGPPRDPSVFAVNQRGVASPLGALSQYPASSTESLRAAVEAQRKIAALLREEQEAIGSAGSGTSRAEAQRWAKGINEGLLDQFVSSRSGIYDGGSVQERLSQRAYSQLLLSGSLPSASAAKLPEEILSALGISPDQAWLRQQRVTSTVRVPELVNYRDYNPGQQIVGSSYGARIEPLQKIVNAAEGPGSFQPRIDQLEAIQQRALANVAALGPAYERLAILDRERLRAAQRAAGAAPRTDLVLTPPVSTGVYSQSTPLPESTLTLFEEIRRAIAVARAQAAQIAAAASAVRGQLIGDFAKASGVIPEVQGILGISSLRNAGQVLPPEQSAIQAARDRYLQTYPGTGSEKLDARIGEALTAVNAKIEAAVGEASAATDLAAAERAAAAAVIAQARARGLTAAAGVTPEFARLALGAGLPSPFQPRQSFSVRNQLEPLRPPVNYNPYSYAVGAGGVTPPPPPIPPGGYVGGYGFYGDPYGGFAGGGPRAIGSGAIPPRGGVYNIYSGPGAPPPPGPE